MGKVYLVLALFIVSLVFIAENHIVTAEPIWTSGKKTGMLAAKAQSAAASEKNSPLGSLTTGNTEVDGYIVESCARHNIDPLLIFAQMKQESGFKQKATSHKGASGLMQLIPATARRFGVVDIYDPQQNIEAGVKYMRWLLNKFDGDTRLALAAYNAGEGAVMKYGNQIPPYRETQTYGARITAHYVQKKTPNHFRSVLSRQTAN
jgi:soluble lytic murein transglycosylase-like protein